MTRLTTLLDGNDAVLWSWAGLPALTLVYSVYKNV